MNHVYSELKQQSELKCNIGQLHDLYMLCWAPQFL